MEKRVRHGLLLAGVVIAAVALVLVLVGPRSSPTAGELNLSQTDMPSWIGSPEGSVGSNPPGMLDGSNRQFFSGAPGGGSYIAVHSAVFRFDSEAHSAAFFAEELAVLENQGDPLEVPSVPPVGSSSVWRELSNNLLFVKEKVVVSIYSEGYGSQSPLSKSQLVDLARIIEARI